MFEAFNDGVDSLHCYIRYRVLQNVEEAHRGGGNRSALRRSLQPAGQLPTPRHQPARLFYRLPPATNRRVRALSPTAYAALKADMEKVDGQKDGWGRQAPSCQPSTNG